VGIMIGTAPDSWGVWFPSDPKQTPAQRFLDEVAEVGYEYIELGPYGYLASQKNDLQRELEARNLKVCAATAIASLSDPNDWKSLENQVLGGGELAGQLGGKYLVLIDGSYNDAFTGAPISPARLDADGWQRLIDTTHRVARMAQQQCGLMVVFHPHAETHVEYEDQIEQLLADTDPALVGLCLDTGHHAYRGGDPVAFMRKHHARIPYLHLKSVDPVLQKMVEAEGWPFAKAVSMDVFCEPSQGAVDFPAFVDVLREVGYHGWGIVEQDMYPAPFDKPLPIAKRTYAYLKSLGMQEVGTAV